MGMIAYPRFGWQGSIALAGAKITFGAVFQFRPPKSTFIVYKYNPCPYYWPVYYYLTMVYTRGAAMPVINVTNQSMFGPNAYQASRDRGVRSTNLLQPTWPLISNCESTTRTNYALNWGVYLRDIYNQQTGFTLLWVSDWYNPASQPNLTPNFVPYKNKWIIFQDGTYVIAVGGSNPYNPRGVFTPVSSWVTSLTIS
jgi:hypothetical protein